MYIQFADDGQGWKRRMKKFNICYLLATEHVAFCKYFALHWAEEVCHNYKGSLLCTFIGKSYWAYCSRRTTKVIGCYGLCTFFSHNDSLHKSHRNKYCDEQIINDVTVKKRRTRSHNEYGRERKRQSHQQKWVPYGIQSRFTVKVCGVSMLLNLSSLQYPLPPICHSADVGFVHTTKDSTKTFTHHMYIAKNQGQPQGFPAKIISQELNHLNHRASHQMRSVW